MHAFGMAEILILAMMSGSIGSTDVVSLVQPTHYFQSRQIEVSFDKMIELAGRDPKDPKTQLQQLVALRHLEDEADKFKKASNYATLRATIEQIAQGKKANDPLGFAQDYANRVLMKLDGTKAPAVKLPPVRDDALAWFPANLTFAAAIDMRQTSRSGVDPIRELLKLMPDREKKEMYDHIEKCGNVRIERFSFGMVDSAQRDQRQYFMRFTGKANQAWCLDMIKALSNGRAETKAHKSPDGSPITEIAAGKGAPAMLAFGNTDFLIAGYDAGDPKVEDTIAQIMDVRAKKKPNAGAGVLKDSLKKVADKAIALLVGDVPNDMQRDLRFAFDAVPAKVVAFVERTQTGLDVQVEGAMANAEDSKKLVEKVGGLRKQGIMELQKAMGQPLPPGLPPIPFQALINLLETLQVQSDADKVSVRVIVPDALIQQIGSLGMIWGRGAGGDFAPPPPPKEEKK